MMESLHHTDAMWQYFFLHVISLRVTFPIHVCVTVNRDTQESHYVNLSELIDTALFASIFFFIHGLHSSCTEVQDKKFNS